MPEGRRGNPPATRAQSRQGCEQVLLTVGTEIGWLLPLHRGRERAHQPQGPLMTFEDVLEIPAARTAALNSANPVSFGIKPWMTRAAASPFHRSDLQHASKSYRKGAPGGFRVTVPLALVGAGRGDFDVDDPRLK